MRLLLLAILAAFTFGCAWLLLYQLGRLFLALMPSAQVIVFSAITILSAYIAWSTVRETID